MRRILLVEDDEEFAHLVASYLARQGFDVVSEVRGDAAVARVAEIAPDLVILDLMLPGMSGLDVCRALRAHNNLPIVMLTAMGEDVDQIVSASVPDGQASITVSDDGPGVEAAMRDRIFEPFVRVDPSRSRASGGLGLGLSIVRRIVEAHGGTVTLEPGDGARFRTTWTVHDDDTNGDTTAAEASRTDG